MSFVVLINFVLQSAAFQYITILGVKPNTTLILICSYAVLRGDAEGALLGFFAGLLQDIYYSPVVGVNALLYMLIGYLCGKPLRDFYKENYFLAVLLVAASSLFYQFAHYFSYFLFRGRVDVGYYFTAVMLPGAVYTVIAAIPLYGLVYLLNHRLERADAGRVRRRRRGE